MQRYGTQDARIAKVAGEILKHAVPKEVLGIVGNNHDLGKNESDTVIYRRWLPFGATTTDATTINQWDVDPAEHLVQEGVTPDADTITAQDITVTMDQYACLYTYTDKAADLYEDNIPTAQKKQTGQRMGLLREMIHYGTLKGCTNKFYSGGTSRATVDEVISLNLLRKTSRSLLGNEGSAITEILSAGPNFNTTSVEAGFIVFAHTDCENDIRELPGFVECASYGSRNMLHECELGSTDRYRFIVSAQLNPILAAGAAIGSTGLVSVGAANVDVYPMIVVADDAWGNVALRGLSSFGVTHIPASKKDKSDPHGQRGYIGAIFWAASFIQNDGWMAVIEVGVTDL